MEMEVLEPPTLLACSVCAPNIHLAKGIAISYVTTHGSRAWDVCLKWLVHCVFDFLCFSK